jgi:hypothetical protein
MGKMSDEIRARALRFDVTAMSNAARPRWLRPGSDRASRGIARLLQTPRRLALTAGGLCMRAHCSSATLLVDAYGVNLVASRELSDGRTTAPCPADGEIHDHAVRLAEWVDPRERRRAGPVGVAGKRGESPSPGVNAGGFKRSAATKDAFQRNLRWPVAVARPVLVGWRWCRRQREMSVLCSSR